MNITVYLGANAGNDLTLTEAVRELGTWIGESGNRLVYGGSKSGLMGVLAKSVVSSGLRSSLLRGICQREKPKWPNLETRLLRYPEAQGRWKKSVKLCRKSLLTT